MNTNRDDVILRLLITRVSGRDATALHAGDDLQRVLGLDTTDLLRLLVAAERSYGVELDSDRVRRLRTYGDLVAALGIAEHPRSKD